MGLYEMARGDCLHLLRQGSIGRVAFTARALPAIRSLPYELVGEDVVVQTRSGRLAQRLDGQVVAFAVDEPGIGSEAGWSVMVRGLAARLLDGDAGSDLVRIDSRLITGRWVPPGAPAQPQAEPAMSEPSRRLPREPC
ncbi:MAG: Pyridoxamine 5-phosphate oxidase [Frankiales bacterium]|jgi:hypothetical protein|nr:Pyridoxamine 5-phosphate oxidase [Frankiales bacterium]